jgi:hypothetical protein
MDDDGSVLRVEQGAQPRGQIQRYMQYCWAQLMGLVEVRAPSSAVRHVLPLICWPQSARHARHGHNVRDRRA